MKKLLYITSGLILGVLFFGASFVLADTPFATFINGLTAKTTPGANDLFYINDNAGGNLDKKITFTNLQTAITSSIFAYPFPSNATSTALTFSAGIVNNATSTGSKGFNISGGCFAISGTCISGAVTSVSNADGTITISPTTGLVVASLAVGHANTWTGQQTFNSSAPIFGTITGSTQCLHVNTSGLISGTGSDCGSGGGSAFPFTATSYGVSTSTTIGLLNGFLSTASSTITSISNLHIPGGSNGNIIATDGAGNLSFTSAGAGTNYFTNSSVNTYLNLGSVLQAPSFNATSTTASSTFAGGIIINNGRIVSDPNTGSTTIPSVDTGNLNFDDGAGVVSWINMPATVAPSGTVESYTASLADLSVLTIYGTSNGSGGLTQGLYPYVGIGTTTPMGNFSVQGPSATSTTKGTCFRMKAVGSIATVFMWVDATPAAHYQLTDCGGTGTTTINTF